MVLPYPHVVGDEEPHRVQPQRHEQRDKLVDAGPDGDAPKRTERRSSFSQG